VSRDMTIRRAKSQYVSKGFPGNGVSVHSSPNNPLQRSGNDKVLARGRASGSFGCRARAQLALRTAAERRR
jgi:hypothetical protein